MKKERITQIEDYEPLVGAETIERIMKKAKTPHHLHVANVNSTYYGGGRSRTADLINSLNEQCRNQNRMEGDPGSS